MSCFLIWESAYSRIGISTSSFQSLAMEWGVAQEQDSETQELVSSNLMFSIPFVEVLCVLQTTTSSGGRSSGMSHHSNRRAIIIISYRMPKAPIIRQSLSVCLCAESILWRHASIQTRPRAKEIAWTSSYFVQVGMVILVHTFSWIIGGGIIRTMRWSCWADSWRSSTSATLQLTICSSQLRTRTCK